MQRCLIVFLYIMLVLAVFKGPVGYSDGDAKFTLLSSESLVHRGTFRLDYYCTTTLDCSKNYRIQKKNGHYYYAFPLGSAIVSMPFVAIANFFNVTMIISENYLQSIMAAFTLLCCFFIFLKISRLFMNPWSSLAVSSTFIFGTSIMSTMGAALWSHNFAMVFALLAIYYSIRFALYSEKNFVLIGLFLFFSYLCRPTLSMLWPCILLFLWTYDKYFSIRCLMTLLALLALFVIFSYFEFHSFLPSYYLPSRLHSHTFWQAFTANLVSPSRGLFVFSPFLLAMVLCYPGYNRLSSLKISWLLIGLLWPFLHLIVISSFPVWWGGWAFGPRFMTDLLPGLFLCSIFFWPTANKRPFYYLRLVFFIISIIFSVYVHTYQGRFNMNAAIYWNEKFQPKTPDQSKIFFDWSIAQFSYPKNN